MDNNWPPKGRPKDSLPHVIHISKAKPVSQKRRKKRLIVKAEVEKLLQDGFIKEAWYTTWLANVVLVKKAKWKWEWRLTRQT